MKPATEQSGASTGGVAKNLARVLEAMALLPLHAHAESRNQSLRSYLGEATGLSKARISRGSLDTLRPSTLTRIDAHQRRLLRDRVMDPAALARIAEALENPPTTRSGMHAPWANWTQGLEVLMGISLPISKAVGLAVDELIDELYAALLADDLLVFKQVLLRHAQHHGAAIRIGDEPAAEPAAAFDLDKIRALGDWSQAEMLVEQLLEALYLDVVSALDAEWSSLYFAGRQSLPLFPLVMVRLQDGLVERGIASSRRNLAYRPSRRLLEFLYALVYYVRYKRWPARPPGPKQLAGILFRPGATEQLDPGVVSSYFDGSTKLTLDLVWEHWDQLILHFLPTRKADQRPTLPVPMVLLALQWQTLLVRNEGKTFLLLDQERYDRLWGHRRRQWQVQQADKDSAQYRAGQLIGEPIDWPVWMVSAPS